MRAWKIERIATCDDHQLEDKIMEIESDPSCKVREIIFIGNNPQDIRLYQIVYTKE